MSNAIYVLGITVTFALLGLWFSSLSDSSPTWTVALGAAVGYALGMAFRKRPPKR